MQKLLRIGQVSNMYGISLDTLRYYDRKGILKPIVDPQNGYRYYSLEHLDVLEMILIGKYLEIPLEQMKERIKSESIDGYLEMMKEQNSNIQEKMEILKKLMDFTQDMTDMLDKINNFHNDYTFSEVTEEEMEVTVYQMDLQSLMDKLDISTGIGIEVYDQWFSYKISNEAIVEEDSTEIGLSLRDNVSDITGLKKYLEEATEAGIIKKHVITGRYKHTDFWGSEEELMKYLKSLSRYFHIKDSVLRVKYRFALLHKNRGHQYFAEIYFPI